MNYYLKNLLYKFAGLLFLFLAKTKYVIKGYSTPRTFSIREYERGIIYDIQVVNNWLSFLNKYSSNQISLKGKDVLELGPGPDLGIGLYLLAKGVNHYRAIDVNNLIASVPKTFYESFFEYLRILDPEIDINILRQQLSMSQANLSDRLNYVCRKDFNIEAIASKESIDFIFSQAAFEHFDDVDETVRQLSIVAKVGSKLISEIDLKTHSRWIRDRDPNNIYRFSERLYRFFGFRGIPNRLRPIDYENILQKYGWNKIIVFPQQTIPEIMFNDTRSGLSSGFQSEKSQMQILSCYLCATKCI